MREIQLNAEKYLPFFEVGAPSARDPCVLAGGRPFLPLILIFLGTVTPPPPARPPAQGSSRMAVHCKRGGGGGGGQQPRQQPAHPQYANYWAPLTRKRHTMPHSAQPQHTNYWAPRTRKRHQREHRPQRPTERSDPTQHAKGRTGDRPGPRKGATTRRNVTQGGRPPMDLLTTDCDCLTNCSRT